MNLPSAEYVTAVAETSKECPDTFESDAIWLLRQFAACIPKLLALRRQATGMVDAHKERDNTLVSPGQRIREWEELARTFEAVIAARTEAAVRERWLHKAWAYAKEHPDECADGYNKEAFKHVLFWVCKLPPLTAQDVPPGYWDKLSAAMLDAPRLPDDDKTGDPPPFDTGAELARIGYPADDVRRDAGGSWRERMWIVHSTVTKERCGTPDDVRFVALALAGEVGELCNLIKKDWRQAWGTKVDDEDRLWKEVADEIADVHCYLWLLSKLLNLDLEQITNAKSKIVEKRYGPEVQAALAQVKP